ncbi:F-box protein CPR1-like [Papaver somniferum]|uniref:F-box protein CPR1-like n=1 Tax=Papaver somniferum TaxID=3469 RepID=UPI000E6F728D|nr:F-box protein CPR1-like [Papaver somniferum]
MPFPAELSSYPEEEAEGISFKSLGEIEECLSLILLVPFVRLDIWVMQKYGVKDSWTRRITTTQEPMIGFGLPKLIRSFENGDVLFSKDLKLALYDTENDKSRDLKMDDSDFLWRVEDSYLESLVSVNSGAYAGKQKWTTDGDTTDKSMPPKMTRGSLFSVLAGLVSYFLT